MKKSIFYSVVVGTILLTQAGHTSAALKNRAITIARQTQDPALLNQAYNDLQAHLQNQGANVAARTQIDSALEVVHNKAVGLPMASPGVTKPTHVTQGDFDALSRVPEFKRRTVEEQNRILTDLDGQIAARAGGPAPAQAADIQAAVGAVLHGVPEEPALVALLQGAAGVAPGGGGGGGGGAPPPPVVACPVLTDFMLFDTFINLAGPAGGGDDSIADAAGHVWRISSFRYRLLPGAIYVDQTVADPFFTAYYNHVLVAGQAATNLTPDLLNAGGAVLLTHLNTVPPQPFEYARVADIGKVGCHYTAHIPHVGTATNVDMDVVLVSPY